MKRLTARALTRGKRPKKGLPLLTWRQRLVESNPLGRRLIFGGAARRPERLELACGQLAEERVDDDQLGGDVLGMGEREHVDELELVVEVVLEPEHDLDAVAERVEQLPVAALERGEQRLPAAPAALGEEAGARVE